MQDQTRPILIRAALLQKAPLRQRLWDRLHLWKSDGQAAADKLARSLTGELSSRGYGRDPGPVPPLSIVMLVAGTRGDVQVPELHTLCVLTVLVLTQSSPVLRPWSHPASLLSGVRQSPLLAISASPEQERCLLEGHIQSC